MSETSPGWCTSRGSLYIRSWRSGSPPLQHVTSFHPVFHPQFIRQPNRPIIVTARSASMAARGDLFDILMRPSTGFWIGLVIMILLLLVLLPILFEPPIGR